MSIIDDASLIFVPNATSNGFLYPQKPESVVGNITRNSKGTYIDKDAIFRTAGNNETRIDYTSGEPKILIEKYDIQLLSFTDNFRRWRRIGCSVSGPFDDIYSELTDDYEGALVKEDTSNSVHGIYTDEVYFEDDVICSYQILIKPIDVRYVGLFLAYDSINDFKNEVFGYVEFDTKTKTIREKHTNSNSTIIRKAFIQEVKNSKGWFKIGFNCVNNTSFNNLQRVGVFFGNDEYENPVKDKFYSNWNDNPEVFYSKAFIGKGREIMLSKASISYYFGSFIERNDLFNYETRQPDLLEVDNRFKFERETSSYRFKDGKYEVRLTNEPSIDFAIEENGGFLYEQTSTNYYRFNNYLNNILAYWNLIPEKVKGLSEDVPAYRITVGSGFGYNGEEVFYEFKPMKGRFSVYARSDNPEEITSGSVIEATGSGTTVNSIAATEITKEWKRFDVEAVYRDVNGEGEARTWLLKDVDLGAKIDIWCPQFERTTYASSPIPTTFKTITRLRDTAWFDKLNEVLSPSGSTLKLDFKIIGTNSDIDNTFNVQGQANLLFELREGGSSPASLIIYKDGITNDLMYLKDNGTAQILKQNVSDDVSILITSDGTSANIYYNGQTTDISNLSSILNYNEIWFWHRSNGYDGARILKSFFVFNRILTTQEINNIYQ